MTSLNSIKNTLDNINLTLSALPKSNTTTHTQGTLFQDVALASSFTFSSTIDLREDQSNRNFRNLTVFGSTSTDSSNISIHLAISQDDTTYFTLPAGASLIRHQTGSSTFDYSISLSNIPVRYVRVYFDRPAANVVTHFIATD